LLNGFSGADPYEHQREKHSMELLGQLIWELVKYFGEMLTIPIVAVLLVVGIVIELLFGKRIRDRRPVDWKTTNAQNWD